MQNTLCKLLGVPAGILSRYVFRDPMNPLTKMADRVDLFIETHLRCVRPFNRVIGFYGLKSNDVRTAN